ncbi:hypothetical protein [Robbsia andropogonis]|uniref:hypothetical protein n=1 Tax=Robbsia andropogonis TaxID=28092 RepID=UPI002A6B4991|nr:hypothetical protein [Robbsia andropogonis]
MTRGAAVLQYLVSDRRNVRSWQVPGRQFCRSAGREGFGRQQNCFLLDDAGFSKQFSDMCGRNHAQRPATDSPQRAQLKITQALNAQSGYLPEKGRHVGVATVPIT